MHTLFNIYFFISAKLDLGSNAFNSLNLRWLWLVNGGLIAWIECQLTLSSYVPPPLADILLYICHIYMYIYICIYAYILYICHIYVIYMSYLLHIIMLNTKAHSNYLEDKLVLSN